MQYACERDGNKVLMIFTCEYQYGIDTKLSCIYIAYIKVDIIDWCKLCFPLSILDRITDGNNMLCVYDCMFNPTVWLKIKRFLYCVVSRRIALRCIAFICIALLYITLHCIILHCMTLHDIT